MKDIHAFIEGIIADLSRKKPFGERVYTDEPILRPAAQMDGYLPECYAAMKAIARDSSPYEEPAAVFYRQAQFMAAHEDDRPCDERFLRYHPTYRALSDRQLRGYFTWRTQVRRGNIRKAATAYAFIYIYELLHLVGVTTPEEGFAALVAFRDSYGPLDETVLPYLNGWLVDFYVYHAPDVPREDVLLPHMYDAALGVLRAFDTQGDDALYTAMCTLSTYHPQSSRFVKAYPADFQAVACRVYRAMAEHAAKRCKNSYFERLFGQAVTVPYRPFVSAVFYDHKPQTDREIPLSSTERFFYRGGTCYHQIDCAQRRPQKELGVLLKAVDAMMRDAVGFPHTVKAPETTKLLVGMIDDAITAHQREKSDAARRAITIDRGKLGSIRAGADSTRDKLLVEEEPDEPTPPPVAAARAPDDTLLDTVAYRFLQLVLYGGDAASFAREHKIPVSVLVETVNEAFYDEFADTVLLCDGDTPFPPEDYIDDLKGRIHP